MTPIQVGEEVRVAAEKRAEEADRDHYIVIPGAPWGGKTATIGPMTRAEARERLSVYLPLHLPECPPKLLRVIEDYEDGTFTEQEG